LSVNVLIALVAAAVTFWLLSYVVPVFLAAIVALIVFFVFFQHEALLRR
jgi:hypothetical protein